IEGTMKDGRTPLHLAATRGSLEVVQWLCSVNPSLILTSVTRKGLTPFHLAILNNHLETAQWLYSQDPSLFLKEGYTEGSGLFSSLGLAKNRDDYIKMFNESDMVSRYNKFKTQEQEEKTNLDMIQWLTSVQQEWDDAEHNEQLREQLLRVETA